MWRRGLDRLYLAAGALGAFFILVIAVLMVGQSLLREMGVRTGAVNDVVAWCCAAAAFLTMAHAFKHGDFVRVTLLLDHVAPNQRRRMEITALSVGLVATGYLAWSACLFTHESWVFNDIAQGMLPMPLWIPQLSFAFGSVLLWVALLDEWCWCGVVPSPPMCARCKRATRVATSPPRSERGHLAHWRLAAVHHVAAAQRRRVDRHDFGHLRLGRAGLFHQHPAGQKPVLRVLGKQCQLGTGRPAPVHLDGRNFVSHQAQRRDVRRPAPLAQPRARAVDAHHHFGLWHFWLGVGLVGRHLRHHQQSGFARIDAPGLRRKAGLGFPWPPRARWVF
jgi:TRAP-type C4-dicarboxylate transport system permease small subunit